MARTRAEQGVPPKQGGRYTRRWIWLIQFLKEHNYTIGAEIGCHTGMTTHKLLKAIPELKLFAVDLWSSIEGDRKYGAGTYDTWDYEWSQKMFDRRITPFKERVQVLQGLSWDMAEYVKDGYLDFVFIDADHSYDCVIKDIKAWVPKLKPGGLLSGHDTHFPTVVKAIDEIVPTWKDAGIDHIWYAKKEDAIL